MHRWHPIVLAALAAALSLAPPAASAQGPKGIGDAERKAVADLQDLAKWCEGAGLQKERDRTLDLVLKIDPDNAEARAALKYTKTKSGWQQDSGYKEPSDKSGDAVGEYKKRRGAVVESFLGALFAYLEKSKDDGVTDERRQALALAAVIAPEDDRLRMARGEAKLSGRWVLAESAEAVANRKKYAQMAKSVLAAVPTPAKDAINADDNVFDVRWHAAFKTANARLLGTGEGNEVQAAARFVEASGPVFQKVFDKDPVYPFGLAIYILQDAVEKSSFIAKIPGFTPEQRKWATNLGAEWFSGGSSLGIWAKDETGRLDITTRMIMNKFIASAADTGSERGWAHEGLGLYMTYLVTGTRLTWTVAPPVSRYGAAKEKDPIEDRLQKTDTDWLQEARMQLEHKKLPALATVLGEKLNEMTAGDTLYAYALAAYFLEGRPIRDLVHFLYYQGKNEPPEQAVKDGLAMTLPDFEARVERWLKETTK